MLINAKKLNTGEINPKGWSYCFATKISPTNQVSVASTDTWRCVQKV